LENERKKVDSLEKKIKKLVESILNFGDESVEI